MFPPHLPPYNFNSFISDLNFQGCSQRRRELQNSEYELFQVSNFPESYIDLAYIEMAIVSLLKNKVVVTFTYFKITGSNLNPYHICHIDFIEKCYIP